MCKFYSAVVSKTGELYHNSFTTSHEDIIAIHQLREGKNGDNICRIEFYPDKDEDKYDYKKYNLYFNDNRPDWFDDELKEKTIRRLRVIIKRMIITEDAEMIVGRAVIMKDCKINLVKNVLIYEMSNSRVGVMYGSSQVGEMYDSSQVGVMRDSSQVGEMYDSSQVGKMWGSSQVGVMYGSSRAPRKPKTDYR